jgi:hypothetical protein
LIISFTDGAKPQTGSPIRANSKCPEGQGVRPSNTLKGTFVVSRTTNANPGADEGCERDGRSEPMRRRPWGLAIRTGSSPSECASMCPQTLQEAKPKAGTIWRRISQSLRETDRRREFQKGTKAQKPIQSHAASISIERIEAPDENQSGRASGRTGMWARTIRNDRSTRCGSKPAKGAGEPHERCPASKREGPTPGQAAKDRIGSGTPGKSIPKAHDRCRAANVRSGGA